MAHHRQPIMTLTAEQTTTLPFPIGCPVWYANVSSNNEGTEAPILKRGTVVSVTLVDKSSPWVYTIEHREGEEVVSDDVLESGVCFSDNCPVLVFRKKFSRVDPPLNDSKDEGIVMFGVISLKGENRYTVMIPNKDSPETRFEENVEEGRLMFRKPPQEILAGNGEEEDQVQANRKRARGRPT
mmetsp:Transcript_9368/g.21229  ORF Transcript_9368/g.21229 Transcript_9368/m.21229 type:complete len:183 (-) Transcript_9368:80-628(-)